MKDIKPTLLVGCGINYAFNDFYPDNNKFLRSSFSYSEILPDMFKKTNYMSKLKSKFKIYLNGNGNDLEEFLRYEFDGAKGSLSEKEKEETKNEFIKILGENHRRLTFRRALSDQNIFDSFKKNLMDFDCIYTTNFDLKLYYLMNELNLFGNKKNNYTLFNDCFYPKKNENCSVGDCKLYPFNESSKIWSLIYLHGSMHLFSHSKNDDKSLIVKKIAKVQSYNLIKKREIICSHDNFYDLFVLGGTTKEKRDIIEKTSYLKQALESLKKIKGDLIIYGCSIDDNDAHIWEIICCNKNIDKIYIGISGNGSGKNRIENHFKGKNISFFSHEDHNIWKEDDWLANIIHVRVI
ncbi:DUF4917 domain-containing protein [Legionella anisa]|uniref:DUF4917 domain-containing protein n=1 Tax=Legionella anisa TaxID=28082 RepID=A0AAX0WV33_9GAMM|nr:DUF4917 family protein [Legionella anisa]AWN73818.1 DUF4917 domain-containing protein [Legionella anisa]KTC71565.1 hypothetical protein Lani_1755 [Legionella anisa]MCW8426074.1 DUF4917 family protein [Legionella anisa]MCW8448385.1 DUF4917 family protein [Legionella anisa]PNL62277.1 DUF4917 domain-containing protein [Legionella anisa]